MHFLKTSAHTSNLLKYLIILKLPDKVTFENWVLICTYFNQYLSKTCECWLIFATDLHT